MEATYPFDAVGTTASMTCWWSGDVYWDAVGQGRWTTAQGGWRGCGRRMRCTGSSRWRSRCR